MRSIIFAFLSTAFADVRLGGCDAKMVMPNGKWVSEFSGKMNVPKEPQKAPHGPHPWLSFWPALGSPLMQTCLTYSGKQGWFMDSQFWGCQQGWQCSKRGDTSHNDCSGRYCDQQLHSGISAGDTITFAIRLSKSSAKDIPTNLTAAGGQITYEIVASTSGSGSQRLVGWTSTSQPPTHVQGIMCENMPDDHQTTPRDPIQIWDMVIKDQNGQAVQPKWHKCTSKNGIKIDCNWKSGSKKGISVTFPSAFSTNWTLV